MANVLIYGKIFRSPERKTSQSGKSYTVATLKEYLPSGDAAWWKCTAFGSCADALAKFVDGESVSMSGAMKIELYEKNGETRVGYSLTVDALISARRPKKERSAQARTERSPQDNHRPQIADDEVPF